MLGSPGAGFVHLVSQSSTMAINFAGDAQAQPLDKTMSSGGLFALPEDGPCVQELHAPGAKCFLQERATDQMWLQGSGVRAARPSSPCSCDLQLCCSNSAQQETS